MSDPSIGNGVGPRSATVGKDEGKMQMLVPWSKMSTSEYGIGASDAIEADLACGSIDDGRIAMVTSAGGNEGEMEGARRSDEYLSH